MSLHLSSNTNTVKPKVIEGKQKLISCLPGLGEQEIVKTPDGGKVNLHFCCLHC
jgi:hypothetical protein